MKYLIVGLGNPGNEYELTRHNIGFLILDQLADKHEATFTLGRHAEKTEIKYKGKSIHLIKPTTYMNLSGKAVNYWLQELGIPTENMLVLTDDISLPHAKLRLRAKGSAGGHNGLTNIEQTLGDSNYARLRFGVGNDFPKGKQADYVLSNFDQNQMDDILIPINKAIDSIYAFCTVGIDQAMTFCNKD